MDEPGAGLPATTGAKEVHDGGAQDVADAALEVERGASDHDLASNGNATKSPARPQNMYQFGEHYPLSVEDLIKDEERFSRAWFLACLIGGVLLAVLLAWLAISQLGGNPGIACPSASQTQCR